VQNYFLILFLALFNLTALAESPSPTPTPYPADLYAAPRPFYIGSTAVVPSDIQSVDLVYEFDLNTKTAKAYSTVRFMTGLRGFPSMDLAPAPTSVSLNGINISLSQFPRIDVPYDGTLYLDGVTQTGMPVSIQPMRVLKVVVNAYQVYSLTIAYDIPSHLFEMSGKAVRLLSDMSDLTYQDRFNNLTQHFWETYAPANLEFDKFRTTLKVVIRGDASDQRIFSNGAVTKSPYGNVWMVNFPDYFTSSSYYLHLADATQIARIESFSHSGIAREIPVTLYLKTDLDISFVDFIKAGIREDLSEMESNFGAYPHSRLTIYLTGTHGQGGMEHSGATMTDYASLSHEISHMWFGRSVIPADGISGWIDEAFASWRDGRYYSSTTPLSEVTTQFPFGAGSLYRRNTNVKAYSDGAAFFESLHSSLADRGGLKALFKTLFTHRKNTVITNEYFRNLLNWFAGRSYNTEYNRLVYGIGQVMPQPAPPELFGFTSSVKILSEPELSSKHPLPLSQEDVKYLR
jgi:hypothetical protein